MPDEVEGIVRAYSDFLELGYIAAAVDSGVSGGIFFRRARAAGDGGETYGIGTRVVFEVCLHGDGGLEAVNVIPCPDGTGPEESDGGTAYESISEDAAIAEISSLVRRFPSFLGDDGRGRRAAAEDDDDRADDPEVIDLVTPKKPGRGGGDDGRGPDLSEDFGELSIKESLSAEEVVAKRVKEAEERGEVIDLC